MRRALLLPILVALLLPASAWAVPDGALVLVDRPPGDGVLPFDGASGTGVGPHALSLDGCDVAFTSGNDIAFEGDDDAAVNVYRMDLCSPGRPVALVSAASDGAPAAAGSVSGAASISADGRYVAFSSDAPNLDPAADGSRTQIFVKDLDTGTLTLASRATGAGGAPAPGAGSGVISGDGRSVAFDATGALDAANDDGVTGETDLYVRRLDDDATVLVSVDDDGDRAGGVTGPFDLTGDGDAVAFVTDAALVPGDGDAGPDAYVARDVASAPDPFIASFATGQTSGADAADAATISTDGSTVAFSNDRVWFAACSPGCAAAAQADAPAPAGSGQSIASLAFAYAAGAPTTLWWATDGQVDPTDTNADSELYGRVLADLTPAGLQRAEQAEVGTRTEVSNVIALSKRAPNGIGDVAFAGGVGDLAELGRPGGLSGAPTTAGDAAIEVRGALSGDGRVVAFTSAGPALGAPPGGMGTIAQVLTRDVATGDTTLISRDGGGAPADADAFGATVSAAGTRVAFLSAAANLVAGVSPGPVHVYVRDVAGGPPQLLDRAGGAPSLQGADAARLSGDGRTVMFASASPDLPGAGGGVQHVYAADVASGNVELVDRTGADVPGSADAGAPDVSADGRFVAFTSSAPEFPGAAPSVTTVYVKDRLTGSLSWAAVPDGGDPADGSARAPALSADGAHLAFVVGAGFGSGVTDGGVAVRTLATGATVAAGSGTGVLGFTQDAPSLSGDGGRVAFVERAAGVPERAYLRDLAEPGPVPVETGRRGSAVAGLNAGGTCVAFLAAGDDLVAGVGPDFARVFLRALGGACPPAAPPAGPGPGPAPPGPPVVTVAPGPDPEAGARLEGPFPAEGSRGPDADIVRPFVGAVEVTNARFSVSTKRTAVRAVVGTALRFSLSEDATTTITIARRTTGRRSGSRCVAPRPGLSRPCTRYVTSVTLTRTKTRRGANRVSFTGRWASGALTPGRYRVTVVARDDAGNRSDERRASFEVVRP